MKKTKRNILGILFFTLVLGMFIPKTSSYATERETVKVGFFIDRPFLMNINEVTGIKSGYGYDYLQTVANYTGWEYEYVYGEWNDLWYAFKEGDIDLLCDVSYVPEREQYVLYPGKSMGNEVFRMYVMKDSSGINVFNLEETLSGKKIGVTANTVQVDILTKWIEENNYGAEVIPYKSDFVRNNDLSIGKIDAVVELEASSIAQWEPVAKIGTSEYYLAVTKERTDLLEELNKALDSIEAVSPQYFDELYFKYFTDVVVSSRLTDGENKWLKEKDVLKIGYLLTDEEPYTKEMLEELFTNIFDSLGISDFNILLFGYSSVGMLQTGISNGDVDVIYPIINSEYVAETQGLSIITQLDSISYRIVTRQGQENNSINTVGVCYGAITSYYLSLLYPSYEIKIYENQKAGLDAVASGEVDIAVMSDYGLESIMNSSRKYNNLTAVGINDVYYKCIAIRRGDSDLFMLLQRGISLLDSKYIASLSTKYNRVESFFSFKEFLISNINYFVFGTLFTALFIIAVIIEMGRRKSIHLQKVSETDSLTGITNRSGENKVRKLIEAKCEGMFCVMDIDKFKTINDTYGHETGDKLLVELASCLQRVFRSNDIILRLGGDEFAVFVSGVTSEDVATQIITRLIEEVNNIRIPRANDIQFSISIGASFYQKSTNPDFETLYKRADMGCYNSKKTEGSSYTFVS